MRAKVDMLIKQKLDKKSKYDGDYRRGKRDAAVDTIEYYDYDGDGEHEARDALANEREVASGETKLSADDKREIKRGEDI